MSDSKLKLYTRVLGPEYGTVKYYLNDNGRNFRACNQVILFVCIDKIPNIFDPNLHHFNDDGFIEYPDGDIEINKFDG
jgi:hypothetical protein